MASGASSGAGLTFVSARANNTSSHTPEPPYSGSLGKELRPKTLPCREKTGLLSRMVQHPPWFETSDGDMVI